MKLLEEFCGVTAPGKIIRSFKVSEPDCIYAHWQTLQNSKKLDFLSGLIYVHMDVLCRTSVNSVKISRNLEQNWIFGKFSTI